jgi:hypothetical protein
LTLIFKRASASRPSGDWNDDDNDDDLDVLADGAVVGRIMKVHAAPVGAPWMWTLAFGHHEDRTAARLRADARGRDGGVREKLAAGVVSKIGKSAFGGKPECAGRPARSRWCKSITMKK